MKDIICGSKYNLIKRFAPLLAALVLFVYIVALAFPVIEQHHICHGEQCPVCEMIELCEGLAAIFGTGLAVTVVSFTVTILAISLKGYAHSTIIRRSPVEEKVRLND